MAAACGNGNDSTARPKATDLNWRDLWGGSALPELAGGVIAPGQDRAIKFEREAMCLSSENGHDSTAGPEAGNLNWGKPVGARAVPDLAIGVAAPSQDRAIRFECQSVGAKCRNRYDSTAGPEAGNLNWGKPVGARAVPDLAIGVVAPGQDRTIGFQGQAVAEGGDNRCDSTAGSEAGDLDWGGPLGGGAVPESAKGIAAPSQDRAIGSERQAVCVACGTCGDPYDFTAVPEARDLNWGGPPDNGAISELAVSVVAPAPDCAVDPKGDVVVVACGNGNYPTEAGHREWRQPGINATVTELATAIGAPGQNGTIESEGQAVVVACACCNGSYATQCPTGKVGHLNWSGPLGGGTVPELTKCVVAPSQDRTIEFARQTVSEACGNGYDSTPRPEAANLNWRKPVVGRAVPELAKAIAAPSQDRTIGFQGQTIAAATCGNSHDSTAGYEAADLNWGESVGVRAVPKLPDGIAAPG